MFGYFDEIINAILKYQLTLTALLINAIFCNFWIDVECLPLCIIIFIS